MAITIKTIATPVKKSDVVNWFNDPTKKESDFLTSYVTSDGKQMKKADLKVLVERCGLNWDDRPKKVKEVFTFELVDDTQVTNVYKSADESETFTNVVSEENLLIDEV